MVTVAVIVVALVMVTAQVPVPLQAPPQLVKMYPGSVAMMSVTGVP